VERAGARGSRAEGGGVGERNGAVVRAVVGPQWGGRRRSCRGPGRDGSEARAARWARSGAAGARRRRRARSGRGRVRTGGVAAREDEGRLRRLRGDGGRAGGGATTEVGRAAARREIAERERETAR
jgi:hypothetical protein